MTEADLALVVFAAGVAVGVLAAGAYFAWLARGLERWRPSRASGAAAPEPEAEVFGEVVDFPRGTAYGGRTSRERR